MREAKFNARGILAVLLMIELAIIGSMALRPLPPEPPWPDTSGYNPYTVKRLRETWEGSDRTSPDAWLELSDTFLAHGFYPEAEACARRGVELKPEDSGLRVRWGFCLSAMGQVELALAQYELAHAIGYPQPQELSYLIGREHLRGERTAAARQAFEQAEPLAAASYELAKLDLRAGDPSAAIKRLQRITEEYPNAFMIHWLRSQAEDQLGNRQAAEDYQLISLLNRQLLPSPVDGFRERYLAQLKRHALSEFVEQQRALVEAGQARQVEGLIEPMRSVHFEPQLEDLQANVDAALGNQPQRIARLEKIIELDGASTYRCWRLAVAYADAGRYREAIDLLKTGLRLDGRDMVRESRETLIELYERTDDLGRARFHVSRLFAWEGEQALGDAKMGLALEKLTAAVQIDPSFADAWYELAIVEGLLGHREQQLKAYEQCVTADPLHGRAQAWLAQHRPVR